MVGQRQYYEGSGPTLDAALREFQGRKNLDRFDAPRLEISIFEHGEDGNRVAHVISGRRYHHVLGLAQEIANHNTKGAYTSGAPGYRTEVTVRGYYH